MTDSMKFGPEWLRNKSNDISSTAYNSASLIANNSIIINKSDNQNGVDHNNPVFGSSFPEFRYGREEMLSLFEKNCRLPEILPLYKNLYVAKVQCPLALIPGIDKVIMQVSTLSIQRPLWLQRPAFSCTGSSKHHTRSGVADKGRLCGKSIYNSSSQRFNLCDDDIKTTKERIRFEHNGNDTPAVLPNEFGVTSDWICSKNCGSKKEFTSQSKYDNWRRNRNDDADDSSLSLPAEDWRMNASDSLGNSHRFSYIKGGRSLQWRHENISLANNNFTYTDSVVIQRSCSSTCQMIEKGNPLNGSCKESFSLQSKNSGEKKYCYDSHCSEIRCHTQESGNELHFSMDDNYGSECNEQNLPEWAIENPSEVGGTFDANGAFHGIETQYDGSLKIVHNRMSEINKTAQTEAHKLDNSINCEKLSDRTGRIYNENLLYNNLNSKGCERNKLCSSFKEADESEKHEKPDSSEKLLSSSLDNARKINLEINLKNEKKLCNHSTSSIEEKESCIISNQGETSNNIFTVSSLSEKSNEKKYLEYIDPLKKVADDMIKKLIMDDDQISNRNRTSLPLSEMCTMVENLNCISHSSVTLSKTHQLSTSVLDKQTRYQSQTQHQIPSFLPLPFLPHQFIYNSSIDFWLYRDPQYKIQGPFSSLEMTEWYRAGYFNEDLFVRRVCDLRFRALGELIKICKGQLPFTNTHLIPTETNHLSDSLPFKSENEDSLNSLREYAQNNLVTNIHSADISTNYLKTDMQQKLNIQFQTLQERFLQNHEADIRNDLFGNECLDNLTELERECIIKQKIKFVLPEYFNHLSNLSSMVSLNASNAFQLYTNVNEQPECEKHFPVNHMTYNNCNNPKYCEVIKEFNSQTTHQQNERFLGEHKIFEKLPKKENAHFAEIENRENQMPSVTTKHSNEFNKHAAPHEYISNRNTQRNDSNIQILPKTGAGHHEVEVSKLPAFMWSGRALKNINIQNNGEQYLHEKDACVQHDNIVNENVIQTQEEEDTVKHIPSPLPLIEHVTLSKETDCSTQNISNINHIEIVRCVSSNLNNEKKYLTEFPSATHIKYENKLTDFCEPNNEHKLLICEAKIKDNTISFNKKYDDCHQEVIHTGELQKEESNHDQMKDDKLFLRNDKVWQIHEAENVNQKVTHHSKVFMDSDSGNNSDKGATHMAKKKIRSLKSSWSLPVNNKIQSPRFIEIQKAERREHHVDQQRPTNVHQKSTFTSAGENEMVLKWHYPHAAAKSLLAIQDEIKNLKENQEESQQLNQCENQNENAVNSEKNRLSSAFNPCKSHASNRWNSKKVWNALNDGFWDDTLKRTPCEISTIGIRSQSLNEQNNVKKNEKKNRKNSETCVTSDSGMAKRTPRLQKEIYGIKQGKTKKSKEENSYLKLCDNSLKNDFETEFVRWCTNSLNNLNNTLDVPTFVTFLCDLESPYEIKNYVRIYLGESKEYVDFAKQFLERRSKCKSLQRAQNIYKDDLCKPAQAITPTANDYGEHKNKQRKLKKNKMTKLDTRILGFSVTAAEGRINIGDRDYIPEL